MHVFHKRFNLRVPLRFLSGWNTPTLQGLLVAALLLAIAAPALYLALQPSGVEGQDGLPVVSLDTSFTPSSIDEGERIRVKVKLDRPLGTPCQMTKTGQFATGLAALRRLPASRAES